jgi:hypothetical protein
VTLILKARHQRQRHRVRGQRTRVGNAVKNAAKEFHSGIQLPEIVYWVLAEYGRALFTNLGDELVVVGVYLLL